MDQFTEDAFTTLEPGEAFTSVINIAALHDVSGGEYTVSTVGAIPFATLNTTEIAGSVAYESNELPLALSDDDIAVVPRAVPILNKRTILRSCSGSQGSEHRQSLSQLIEVARFVANEARTGDAAVFQEFFKTTSSTTRSTVAARYDAIVREASSTTSGSTTYYCTDPYGYCSPNTLAYALPSQNLIANCPIYYDLSTLSTTCRQQDQVTTALHEMTHTPGVFGPGTQDLAYGYAASTRLTASQSLQNADTFALYANGESYIIPPQNVIVLTCHVAVLNAC
jgi:deuterolysin